MDEFRWYSRALTSTEIEFIQNELKDHIYSSNFPSLIEIDAPDSISGFVSCLDISGFKEYFENCYRWEFEF